MLTMGIINADDPKNTKGKTYIRLSLILIHIIFLHIVIKRQHLRDLYKNKYTK